MPESKAVQVIEIEANINRIATSLSKEGDVIIKAVISHNVTKAGSLQIIGDLVAMQQQTVSLAVTPRQLNLGLKKE